jgi:peptidoglycan/LPS O-acetylase OafA/YrhL
LLLFHNPKVGHNQGGTASYSYVYGLDGFRAIAVALVFFGHYRLIGAGAMFGVQLFFVISGLIITKVLLGEWTEEGKISVKRFYARRFLRLSPALYVSIPIIVAAWTLAGRSLDWPAISAAALYYSNYYLSFHPTSDLYYMPLWSLAVEEHYYLIFPAALVLVLKFFRVGRAWPFVIAFAAVLVWRSILYMITKDFNAIYLRTDTRIDALLAGVVVALVISTASGFKRYRPLAWALSALGLVLLGVSAVIRNEAFRSTVMYTLQSVGIGAVLCQVLYGGGRLMVLARQFLEGRILKTLGKWSYSIYPGTSERSRCSNTSSGPGWACWCWPSSCRWPWRPRAITSSRCRCCPCGAVSALTWPRRRRPASPRSRCRRGVRSGARGRERGARTFGRASVKEPPEAGDPPQPAARRLNRTRFGAGLQTGVWATVRRRRFEKTEFGLVRNGRLGY